MLLVGTHLQTYRGVEVVGSDLRQAQRRSHRPNPMSPRLPRRADGSRKSRYRRRYRIAETQKARCLRSGRRLRRTTWFSSDVPTRATVPARAGSGIRCGRVAANRGHTRARVGGAQSCARLRPGKSRAAARRASDDGRRRAPALRAGDGLTHLTQRSPPHQMARRGPASRPRGRGTDVPQVPAPKAEQGGEYGPLFSGCARRSSCGRCPTPG